MGCCLVGRARWRLLGGAPPPCSWPGLLFGVVVDANCQTDMRGLVTGGRVCRVRGVAACLDSSRSAHRRSAGPLRLRARAGAMNVMPYMVARVQHQLAS